MTIKKSFYLQYENGQFIVVDYYGVKIPQQIDIEVTQDFGSWADGECYAKVGMRLKQYKEPKKED
tara:strand:+ start:2151 stop:2345 length:195 start_codon:yes stop_codon:yes gene_type:complete